MFLLCFFFLSVLSCQYFLSMYLYNLSVLLPITPLCCYYTTITYYHVYIFIYMVIIYMVYNTYKVRYLFRAYQEFAFLKYKYLHTYVYICVYRKYKCAYSYMHTYSHMYIISIHIHTHKNIHIQTYTHIRICSQSLMFPFFLNFITKLSCHDLLSCLYYLC